MGWRRTSLLYIALVAVQVAFSGWHVLGSVALKHDTVALVFACYRELIAVVCMYLIAVPTEGLHWPKREHYPRFLLLGLLNFLNVAGFILGLKFTNADLAAIYQCCIPVWCTALGLVLQTENINMAKSIGILFSVIGAVLTTYFSSESGSNHGSNMFIGNVLLIVQSFSISAMIVYQREILIIYPWHKSVVAWGYTPAAVLSGLASLYYVNDPSAWDLGEGNEPWIALIYAAVVATMFTYITMGWVNKYTSSSTVGAFMTLQPIFTSILNYFAQHITIGNMEVVGGAIVILGLLIVSWAKHKEEKDVKRAFEDRLNTSLLIPKSEEGTPHVTVQTRIDGSIRLAKDTDTGDDDFYHTPVERRTLQGTGYTPVSAHRPRITTVS